MWANSRRQWGIDSLGCCNSWVAEGRTWLSDWTTKSNGTVIPVYFPWIPFPHMPLYVAHKCRGSLPGGTSCKEPACQCRRHKRCGSVPRSGGCPEVGNGKPLQYSCLENPRDREVLWATVHRVTNSRSDTTEATQHTQRKGQEKKCSWISKRIT